MIQTLTKDGLLHELTDAALFQRYDTAPRAGRSAVHRMRSSATSARTASGRYRRSSGSLRRRSSAPTGRSSPRLGMTRSRGWSTRRPAVSRACRAGRANRHAGGRRRRVARRVPRRFRLRRSAQRGERSGAARDHVVRSAIVGPTPLAVIDKNTPGAGATLLTEVLGIVANGRLPGLDRRPERGRRAREAHHDVAA